MSIVQGLRQLGWKRASLLALLFAPIFVLMIVYARATYWQCDDAYISFRYVWQWVHGHGLVWNVDERVEGYTNFLWVVELSAIWKVFGVAPEIACDWLSTLCTIATLACIVTLACRGPWKERRVFVAFGTLLLLATSRTWAVWSTSGLETRQFTLFVVLGVLLTGSGLGRPRRLIAASLAFTAAEFTRPEGPLLWAMAGTWLLLEMAKERRFSWRDVFAYGVPLVVLVGAHYLWRHAYYGDWFPNTYYAKYVRPWPEAGLRYYGAAAIESGAWIMLPFAIVGAFARARRGDRTHFMAALVIVAHMIYLVRIGGDHFEMRPLDFYWPFLFLATVEGMFAISARLHMKWRAEHPLSGVPREGIVASLLLAIAVVYGFAVQEAKREYTSRYVSRETSHFLVVKLDHENSPTLFALPGMSALIPAYDSMQAYALLHGVGTVWQEHQVFWREEIGNWKPYEIARGHNVFPPDSITARGSIGVSGYYLADVEVVDQLGLTDRHVAHEGGDPPNDKRYMAHDRRAQPEYLFERGLNVYVEPAAHDRHEALLVAPFALELPGGVWMPFSSRKPDWVEKSFRGQMLWQWKVAKEIGCFQDGVDSGWTFEGDAFAFGVRSDVPLTRTIQWQARCATNRGVSSRDLQLHGVGTGTARSPLFHVTPGSTLELRVYGVRGEKTGIRVVDSQGSVLADLHPNETVTTMHEYVDLAAFVGRDARVELYDGDDESWVGALGIVLLEPHPLDGN